MEILSEKEKRKRRTKKELEEIIWNAFERLVIKDGFNRITLIKLAREAGVEPPVIYNRFENEDILFEQYARRNDFWLNKAVNIDPKLSPKENTIKVFVDLIDHLYDNEIMQRILLWGLNDTHKITRQIAMQRDFENIVLIDYFNDGLKKNGLNVNIFNAMILSGIYYLILQRKISTFCTVNFNRAESKEELKKMVREMVNRLF